MTKGANWGDLTPWHFSDEGVVALEICCPDEDDWEPGGELVFDGTEQNNAPINRALVPEPPYSDEESITRLWREDLARQHSGQTCAERQNRRAERKGYPGTLRQSRWEWWAGRFNGRCAYCATMISRPVCEHVVPLSKGGENTIFNVVPSCGRCNSVKSTHSLENFFYHPAMSEFLRRVLIAGGILK